MVIHTYYKNSIILLLFILSLSFCQTEYEDLIKQSEEYMNQKNYKAAINTSKKAHEIDRNINRSKDELMLEESIYYAHLGYLYSMDNQLKEGNTYLLKAIEIDSTIVMPSDAPEIKLVNTKKYGAKIVLYDKLKESREEIAQDLAKKNGILTGNDFVL